MDDHTESKVALADELRRRLRVEHLYRTSMTIGPYDGEGFDVLLILGPDEPPTDDQLASLCPDIRVIVKRGNWQRNEDWRRGCSHLSAT